MAHQAQINYCLSVKKSFPEHFKNKNVLDAGSLDINWNNRYLFEDCNYIGIDVWEWNNVDIVCSANEYIPEWDLIDVVISTEMLEHNKFWKESLINLYSILKSGWLMIMTCAWYWRHEHWTTRTSPQDAPFTTDYYMNIESKHLSEALCPDELFSFYEIKKIWYDICFTWIKK